MELFGLLAYAFLAGSLLPVQAGLNMQLAKNLGHPLLGALASFFIGTIVLIAYALLTGVKVPGPSQLSSSPYWMWIGGIMGAFYVAATVILSPRLGAATTIALFVAGQMLTSIMLDHHGIVGFPAHPANIWRMLGAALVVMGVILIRMF